MGRSGAEKRAEQQQNQLLQQEQQLESQQNQEKKLQQQELLKRKLASIRSNQGGGQFGNSNTNGPSSVNLSNTIG